MMGYNTQTNFTNLSDSIISAMPFKVKQIDKPKVNLTTVELNQYNKKRLVYSKVDYGEASIKLHDTVDNSVLSFWTNYFTYYIGDSRIKQSGDYSQNPTDPEFLDSTGWGFRPLSEDTSFFNKITIYAFFGQTITSFSYINPKIVSVDWQQKDYASSDPEEVTINFKYEAIQFEKFGEPLNDFDTGFLEVDQLKVIGRASPPPPAQSQPMMFTNRLSSYNPLNNLSSLAASVNPRIMATTGGNPWGISSQGLALAPGSIIPIGLLTQAFIGSGVIQGGLNNTSMMFDNQTPNNGVISNPI